MDATVQTPNLQRVHLMFAMVENQTLHWKTTWWAQRRRLVGTFACGQACQGTANGAAAGMPELGCDKRRRACSVNRRNEFKQQCGQALAYRNLPAFTTSTHSCLHNYVHSCARTPDFSAAFHSCTTDGHSGHGWVLGFRSASTHRRGPHRLGSSPGNCVFQCFLDFLRP